VPIASQTKNNKNNNNVKAGSMFIVNAKTYHYFINLLFLYVCMLISYVLMCPLHMHLLTSWAYVPCMCIQCDCSCLFMLSGSLCCYTEVGKIRYKGHIDICLTSEKMHMKGACKYIRK
jgi:hypothetical protein